MDRDLDGLAVYSDYYYPRSSRHPSVHLVSCGRVLCALMIPVRSMLQNMQSRHRAIQLTLMRLKKNTCREVEENQLEEPPLTFSDVVPGNECSEAELRQS